VTRGRVLQEKCFLQTKCFVTFIGTLSKELSDFLHKKSSRVKHLSTFTDEFVRYGHFSQEKYFSSKTFPFPTYYFRTNGKKLIPVLSNLHSTNSDEHFREKNNFFKDPFRLDGFGP